MMVGPYINQYYIIVRSSNRLHIRSIEDPRGAPFQNTKKLDAHDKVMKFLLKRYYNVNTINYNNNTK
jgi:hypothetical protein